MLYKIIETPQGSTSLSFDKDRLLEKTAYAEGVVAKEVDLASLTDDMRQFINTDFRPRQGFCYLAVNALSDEETFGYNVNGDAMPRYSMHGDPLLIYDGESHGYKTYEKYGHWFHHHNNRDPSKSSGKVIFSSYDVPQGIVRIIVEIDRTKDPETCTKIDQGIMPMTSMGLKVPFDICSKCGQDHGTRELIENYIHEWFTDDVLRTKYPTPGDYVLMHNSEHNRRHGRNIPGLSRWTSEYCEHLRHKMGTVDELGFAYYAINHLAKLFDISRVFVNADKVSQGLFKLAVRKAYAIPWHDLSGNRSRIFNGGVIEEFEKVASPAITPLLRLIKGGEDIKQGTIEKEAPTAEAKKLSENITNSVAEEVSDTTQAMDCESMRHPLPESFMQSATLPVACGPDKVKRIFSSLFNMRMFPNPHEFQRLFLSGLGLGDRSDKLDEIREIFTGNDIPDDIACDLKQRHGPMIEKIFGNLGKPDNDLMGMLSGSLPERSFFPNFYYPRAKRTIIMIKSGSPPLPISPISSSDIPPARKPLSLLETMGLAAIAFPIAAKAFGNKVQTAKISPKAAAIIAALSIGGTLANKAMEPEASLDSSLSVANQIEKTGGIAEFAPWSKDLAKAYLGALATMPVIHGYSTYQKRKAMRGEPLGGFGRFAALNPDVLSLGYLLAGPVAARGGVSAVKNLLKTGTVMRSALSRAMERDTGDPVEKMPNPFDWKDRLASGVTWGLMTPGAFIPGMMSGLVDTEFFHKILS
jgi:hypothetical protein